MQSRLTNGGLLAKLAAGPRAIADLARRGAGLARGPGEQQKLVSAPWSGTWPAPGATLDLDFANDRGFVRGVGSGSSMDAVTFTRASNGTFVGSDGKLAGSGGNQGAEGKNLLTFPQDFDNAVWTKTNASVQANVVIAPDGTLTADKAIETTANADHRVTQTISSAGSSTLSVYAKAAERTFMFIASGVVNANAIFDLVNGIAYPASAATAQISNAGNGWYRCQITVTSPTSIQIGTALNSTTISYTGDGTSGIFIWGAQLELGSTATTYYPTNINERRRDWASTATVAQVNLFTYTEDLSNSVWTKTRTTVSTDVITAPTGTTTADAVYETATTNTFAVTNNIARTGTYASSVYLKANGRTFAGLFAFSGLFSLANGAVFNLSTGVVASTGASVISASISDAGNGWWRCSVVALNPTGYQIYPMLDATTASYAGDVTKGLYVWGAQIELGSSVTAYQAVGAFTPTNTPLVAASTCNGLLIEESRTNRILWCRDATSGTGTNLLTYSEQFNNGAWSKLNASISADAAVAPDGNTTADLFYPTASGQSIVYWTVTIHSRPQTISIYVKASGFSWVALGTNTNLVDVAFFNVSTGTVGNIGSNIQNATISAVGSGWYRISAVATASASGSSALALFLADGNGSITTVTASGTNGVYIWGAQAVPGSVLTDYQVTTNLPVYGWSKSNVTVYKNQEGVDGVANAATSITASAANGTLIQPIALASGSRTGSVYLKRITGTGNVQVSLDGSTWSTVELSSTEWRRIVLSGTVTNPVVGIRIATSGDAVAMDYAQVEDGAFATTPILTTTATATRAQDFATMSGQNFDTWINLQQGTVKCDFIYLMPLGLGDQRAVFSIDNNNNGSDFSYIRLFKGSFASAFQAFTNGSSTSSVIPITQNALSSIAISATRTAGFSCPNGGLTYFSGISSGLGTLPFTRLYIGGYAQNIASCVTIKRFVFFPKAMPGSLQALSTL